MKETLILYKDWWEAIKSLPTNMQLEAYNSICAYAFEGVMPTDTMMFEYRIENLSHILIEANYSDEVLNYNIENGITPTSMRSRLLQSHMEIKTTENILLSSNLDSVNEIVLIHLSNNNSDAEQFKQRIMQKTGKPVIIAKRGVTVEVSKQPY